MSLGPRLRIRYSIRTDRLSVISTPGVAIGEFIGIDTRNGRKFRVKWFRFREIQGGSEMSETTETECHHCGYEWDYSGNSQMATCPHCYNKTEVNS